MTESQPSWMSSAIKVNKFQGSTQGVSDINSAKIYKLVIEISCLQVLSIHKTDRQNQVHNQPHSWPMRQGSVLHHSGCSRQKHSLTRFTTVQFSPPSLTSWKSQHQDHHGVQISWHKIAKFGCTNNRTNRKTERHEVATSSENRSADYFFRNSLRTVWQWTMNVAVDWMSHYQACHRDSAPLML